MMHSRIKLHKLTARTLLDIQKSCLHRCRAPFSSLFESALNGATSSGWRVSRRTYFARIQSPGVYGLCPGKPRSTEVLLPTVQMFAVLKHGVDRSPTVRLSARWRLTAQYLARLNRSAPTLGIVASGDVKLTHSGFDVPHCTRFQHRADSDVLTCLGDKRTPFNEMQAGHSASPPSKAQTLLRPVLQPYFLVGSTNKLSCRCTTVSQTVHKSTVQQPPPSICSVTLPC